MIPGLTRKQIESVIDGICPETPVVMIIAGDEIYFGKKGTFYENGKAMVTLADPLMMRNGDGNSSVHANKFGHVQYVHINHISLISADALETMIGHLQNYQKGETANA